MRTNPSAEAPRPPSPFPTATAGPGSASSNQSRIPPKDTPTPHIRAPKQALATCGSPFPPVTNLHASATPGLQMWTSSTQGRTHPRVWVFLEGLSSRIPTWRPKQMTLQQTPLHTQRKLISVREIFMTGFQGDGAPTRTGAARSGAAVPCGSSSPAPRTRRGLPPRAAPAPQRPAPQRRYRSARAQGGPPGTEGGPQPPPPCPRVPVPEQRGRGGRSGRRRRAAQGRRRGNGPNRRRRVPAARPGTARSPALAARPAPVPLRTAGGVPPLRNPHRRRSLPRRSATLGAAFQQSAKRSRAASSPSSRRAQRPPPAGGGTARSRTAPGPPRPPRVPQR